MTDQRPPRDGDEKAKVTPLRRFEAHEEDFDGANDESLMIKFAIIQQEHADLDSAIRALETQTHHDRLSVARLKKKKLQLKDLMQEIRDQMTPDIIA